MFNPPNRALISVSDKTGLSELAAQLTSNGFEILSTGGTARYLQNHHIEVTPISDFTGFPEILDGRVKTLHPLIHGAILGNPANPDHVSQMNQHGIAPIQLVVVNLYPFRKTVMESPADTSLIIENIDIGGPCLIRAAAKNHHNVLVVTDPLDYPFIAEHIRNSLPFPPDVRQSLAAKAFSHTSRYDQLISEWMRGNKEHSDALPDQLQILLEKKQILRYGENPHQQAAIYRCPFSADDGLLAFDQLGGKEISFNNLLDTQAAWALVMQFSGPAAAVVKHQNPCGVALDVTLSDAFQSALACDPVSAFGGIVALNQAVDIASAHLLNEAHFLEVIAAPAFSPESLEILRRKKNRRLVQITNPPAGDQLLDVRMLHNGALIQTVDNSLDPPDAFQTVTRIAPSPSQMQDLIFAWNVCRFVKSNAIVCAHSRRAVGVGAGQMSRVDSVSIALKKAGESARGGVLASDAFFPFRDSVDLAAEAGITALIQPGGSKGDPDVIDACNSHGIAMIFTGVRHFKH